MSRFRIFLAILAFAVLIVGLFVWQYVSSFHEVNFTVTKGLSVSIYQVVDGKNQNSFKTISESSAISVQDGNYCAQPNDTKYDNTPVCFTVNKNSISVAVTPDYSSSYLSGQLKTELPAINGVIASKYSAIIDNFVLNTGSLYMDGSWYGGTFIQKVQYANDQGDVYRFILHKVYGEWKVVAFPQIVVNKYDYPNIPVSVLDAVNKLVGVQG